MNAQSGNPSWVSLFISFLIKNHSHFQLSNPVATEVVVLLSYEHKKLVPKANGLAVLPFSNIIPLKDTWFSKCKSTWRTSLDIKCYWALLFYEGQIKALKMWFWGHCLNSLWMSCKDLGLTRQPGDLDKHRFLAPAISSETTQESAVIRGRVWMKSRALVPKPSKADNFWFF